MLNNKVIKILGVFTRKEMTRFKEFVHSPYHNKHRQVRQLVAYLSRVYPHYNEPACRRDAIIEKVFPATSMNFSQLAVLFTYTYRLLERFLVVEELHDRPVDQNLLLLRHMRAKRLHDQYEKKLREQQKELEADPLKNSYLFYQNYVLAAEADLYYDMLAKHQQDWSIQKKQDNLDRFYLAEKLKDACEMKVRSKILEVEYVPGMIGAVLEEVASRQDHFQGHPAIYLYFLLYRMLEGETSDSYLRVLKEVRLRERAFSTLELQSIYNRLEHFCIDQINKGRPEYLNELFKLYQIQLEKRFLFENGQLSEWHFKNIVTTGLRLKEMAWVDQFIENYIGYIRPQSRQNAYTFNKASYFYELGAYEKVLELLLKVEYSDIRYAQGAKALLLRTYYDMEAFEAFLSLADSFKQYLQRNKTLSDVRRRGFYNLIRLARKAFQLKMDGPYLGREKYEKTLQKLLDDMSQAETLFNQSWLEEKVEELKYELL